jgi:N-acylneuraminate cytidylyltransferase
MPSVLDPCLAVIPARGGSKGLPGKNVRPLAGLPLLAHSVRCAERVARVRRTIVSTDSEEIAEVARRAGAEVPFLRPAELAPEDVERAFAMLDGDAGADGVVACSRPHFNPLYVGVVEKGGYVAPAFEGAVHLRRQDAPQFFRINGALYLWRRAFVVRTGPAWIQGRHRLLEIPELRAFSIDDAQDMAMAELAVGSGMVRLPWL